MKQIFEGYKYLFDNRIMHWDLKPDNVFLCDGVPKIGDYGFGIQVDEESLNEPNIHTKVYTPMFASP